MHYLARAARTVRAGTLSRSLATSAVRAAPPKPATPTPTPASTSKAAPDGKDTVVDPAARGVSEMRRQWGGLIDKADRETMEAELGETGEAEAGIDLDAHDGLEGKPEKDVDPAARGVSEMRKQWGDLIDEKK